jgi:serine/threonine protein kinase
VHVVKKIKIPDDDKMLRMIQCEYLILKQINHPRLLSLVHYYANGSTCNFVLPYMSNGSLNALIDTYKSKMYKFAQSDLLAMFMVRH